MAVNVATFRIRFPEFSDVTEYPDARIQLFIDDTVLYIGSDETRWCNKYDIAQAYLAAHLLSIGTLSEAGDSSSSSGAITTKKAGGVSVTRASNSSQELGTSDGFYISTIYGQMFLNIRNTCFVGALVANCL